MFCSRATLRDEICHREQASNPAINRNGLLRGLAARNDAG